MAENDSLDGKVQRLSAELRARKAEEENHRLASENAKLTRELEERRRDYYNALLDNTAVNQEKVIKWLQERKIYLPCEEAIIDIDSLALAKILKGAGVLGRVMQEIEGLYAARKAEDEEMLDEIAYREDALRAVEHAFICPETLPSTAPFVAEDAERRLKEAVKMRSDVYKEILDLIDKAAKGITEAFMQFQAKSSDSISVAAGRLKEFFSTVRKEIEREEEKLNQSRAGNQTVRKKADRKHEFFYDRLKVWLRTFMKN